VCTLSYTTLRQTSAESRPFVRQEIGDSQNDWSLLKQSPFPEAAVINGTEAIFKPALNVAACKDARGKIPSPNIGAASYASDGKGLNGTIWLSSPFTAPFANSSKTLQPFLRVDAIQTKNTTTLNDLVKSEFDALKRHSNWIIGPNPTNIGNNVAYKLEFEYTGIGGESCKNCKAMEILAMRNDRLYVILYVSDVKRYSDSINEARAMINSIIIGSQESGVTKKEVLPSNLSVFRNSTLNLRMRYPGDWIKVNTPHASAFGLHDIGHIGGIMFRSPNIGPYSLYKEYAMFLNVNSEYNTGSSAYVIRLAWDYISQSWKKTVEEWSSNGQNRILHEIPNYKEFFADGKGYILLNVNLGIANFPDQYVVSLSAIDQFVNNGRLCTMTDRTTPIALPPPQYSVTASPNFVKLEPGSKRDIQILIRSGTNLESHVTLHAGTIKGLYSRFTPSETYVSSANETNIDLQIQAYEDSSSDIQYTLPLNANFSFAPVTSRELINTPIFFYNGPNVGPVITNYSDTPSLSKASNVTIAIHALTPEERVSNFYNNWLTPVTGIWSFVAGVAAVIGPLLVRIYTKRKDQNKNRSLDKWSNP
jgi:hypothetical protein